MLQDENKPKKNILLILSGSYDAECQYFDRLFWGYFLSLILMDHRETFSIFYHHQPI